jgi:hypothetical protein
MVKRLVLLNGLAALPLLVLALADPDAGLAKLDPFVVFRLILLVWVVIQIWHIVEHLTEDLRGIREFLVDLENATPNVRGLTATGERVFRWSIARAIRLVFRVGWPSLVLAAAAVALNAGTWLVLSGWRPEFLRGIAWS